MTRAGWSLVVVVLFTLAASPATAAPRKAKKSPGEIAAYWTDERMKQARPRDRARPGGGGGTKTTSDWSSFDVASPTAPENRVNGKVFFTLDGSRYVCSGTAVTASPAVNLVWTAGHCVTDGRDASGNWHDASEFMFIPAYPTGESTYGRWTMTELDSTPGWEDSGGKDYRYDVGAVRVTRTMRNPATGAWEPAAGTFASVLQATRPIVFGQPVDTQTKLLSFGYPAAGKFKGTTMHACWSPFRQFDPWNTATPTPMQISCDMTGGSSGGGWIHDTDGDKVAALGESLVSVNSYGYGFESKTMYGPQMLSQAEALYGRMD